MKPKLLMFDVDGTIIDSFEHAFESAKNFIVEKTNETITQEEYRSIIQGNSWENILVKIGVDPSLPVKQDSIPGLIGPYNNLSLFDDIKSTLQKLAQQYPMIINTSTFIPLIMPVFEREEIDLFFSMYMGPEVSIYKDKKIALALEEFKIKPQELLFITDTVGDIKEGKKVGVQTAAVTWGFNTEEQLKEVAPDYLLYNTKELESLLLS